MARKSPAKIKAVKTQGSDKFLKQNELPPIRETFDNIKQVIINTAEVAVVQAERIGNLANLREAAYRFWGNEFDSMFVGDARMDYLKDLQAVTIATYEDILYVVQSFELEEFLKEDMKDYFDNMMPKPSEIHNENELFKAILIADIIKPWGEKMVQFHHQMLDEQGQRKAMEEDL